MFGKLPASDDFLSRTVRSIKRLFVSVGALKKDSPTVDMYWFSCNITE